MGNVFPFQSKGASSIACHHPSQTNEAGGEHGSSVKQRNHTRPSHSGDVTTASVITITRHRVQPAQAAVHGQGRTSNQLAGSSQPLQGQMEMQETVQLVSHPCLLAQARLWAVALRTGTESTWEDDGEVIAEGDRTLYPAPPAWGAAVHLALHSKVGDAACGSRGIYFSHSGGMFVLRGSGGETMMKKFLEKKGEWGSGCMFQQLLQMNWKNKIPLLMKSSLETPPSETGHEKLRLLWFVNDFLHWFLRSVELTVILKNVWPWLISTN